MRWSERKEGGVAILDLRGKMTIGPVSLRDPVRDLIDRGEKKILLNLKDLTYICSAGINQLVAAYTSAANAGAALKLLNPTAGARSLLQATELIRVFESFDDEAQAVASFGDSQYQY